MKVNKLKLKPLPPKEEVLLVEGRSDPFSRLSCVLERVVLPLKVLKVFSVGLFMTSLGLMLDKCSSSSQKCISAVLAGEPAAALP